jgi:hypothetical protein
VGARATCFCVAAARACGSQGGETVFSTFCDTFGRLADKEFSYLLLIMLCYRTWCLSYCIIPKDILHALSRMTLCSVHFSTNMTFLAKEAHFGRTSCDSGTTQLVAAVAEIFQDGNDVVPNLLRSFKGKRSFVLQ